MACGLEHQRLAADSGYWPLYRYDPRRTARGEHPLVLDSMPPRSDVGTLMAAESRFQATAQQDPERYGTLVHQATEQIRRRWALYEGLARGESPAGGGTGPAAKSAPALAEPHRNR